MKGLLEGIGFDLKFQALGFFLKYKRYHSLCVRYWQNLEPLLTVAELHEKGFKFSPI